MAKIGDRLFWLSTEEAILAEDVRGCDFYMWQGFQVNKRFSE